MSNIYLDVPLLNQHRLFPTRGPNQACWYTSVMMVLLFRMGLAGISSVIQIDTLKRLFDNVGLGPGEDGSLAREVGLEHSPSQAVLGNKTLAEYQHALRALGPLVMSQPTHVIVARGAITTVSLREQIVFNDPWMGIERRAPLEEFNNSISWHFPIHFRRSTFRPPSPLALGPNQYPFNTKY